MHHQQLRINALRAYQVEYYHAIRNGKSSEDAAGLALTRVKEWFLVFPDTNNLEGYDREEAWGDILGVLIEWQILLKGIPIDRSKIPPKSQIAEKLENQELINPPE